MVELAPRAHKIAQKMPARLVGIQIHSPNPLSPQLSIAKSGLPSDHLSGRFPASEVPVHKKDDDRADHRAYQAGSSPGPYQPSICPRKLATQAPTMPRM